MSIMVDLPPQMASEVRDYVTADNEELSRMLFNYLKDELARRRTAQRNPLAKYVGCIADGQRSDDVMAQLRGYDQW